MQKLGRKKRKKEGTKKEINLLAAKSGLVGMKGYHKTYNHMKYFLPSGRFSDSKTKVT